MKTGIPLPETNLWLEESAPALLHIVPPPPRLDAGLTSLQPTMRLDDPLKTEQMLDGASALDLSAMDSGDDLQWSGHGGSGDDENLEEHALMARAADDWDTGSASRVKRQARRLLALARKMV